MTPPVPASPAQPSRRGGLRRALRRFSTASTIPATPRDPEAGIEQLATAPMRVPVTLVGTIRQVTINPRGINRWLEAVLDDGTGEVTLIWMGRRVVRGIDAGRRLQVTGTITLLEGRRAIYNPNYSLLG